MMDNIFYDAGAYLLNYVWVYYFSKCKFRSKKIMYALPLIVIAMAVCENAVDGIKAVPVEIALLFGVSIILFKEKIWNILIRVIFAYFYMGMFELPLDTILYILKYKGIDYTNNYYILGSVFYASVAILILLSYNNSKRHFYHYIEGLYANRYYYIGILIGFSASGMDAYLRLLVNDDNSKLSLFIFVVLSILIEMVYFLGVSVFLIDTVRMQYKKELVLKNEYLEMTQEYYQNLERQMLEIRKIRHEMNQHLNTIQYYIKSKEYGKATAYIQSTGDQISQIESNVNVGNELLNISISHIKKLHNVKLRCEGHIGKDLPISEGELCIVVVNILKNAMEYCENSNMGEKECALSFREFQSHLVIHCENPVEENIDVERLGTYSTKNDKMSHGFGISNVKEIVEKYEGEVSFSCEDGVFSVDIIL